MKSWLRKKLIDFLQSDTTVGASISEANCVKVSRETDSVQDEPVLNFRVFSAVGGKVVEFSRYDRRSDRRDCTTYIITNEQDFGERISKIATMENLKN